MFMNVGVLVCVCMCVCKTTAKYLHYLMELVSVDQRFFIYFPIMCDVYASMTISFIPLNMHSVGESGI